jgi:homoserine dehydrogenase
MNKSLNIAIAGLGTVGAEVARQLTTNQEHFTRKAGRPVNVVAVSARDANKDRGFSMDGIDFCQNPLDLAARKDVDMVIELIGGSEGVAFDLVAAALKQGRHVVTANKALLAHHGLELATLAETSGLALAGEASVAGGIPVVKMLKESLAGNQITRITGILNGTCNYILSVMQHESRDFDDVLAEAQALGYAEADPSFDIDGVDAAHKLAILAAIGFGYAPAIDEVSITGIRHITLTDMQNALHLGFTIRLLGEAELNSDGQVAAMVRPVLLPRDNSLAKIDGPLNAVAFTGEPIGGVTAIGPGAGAGATASAVLADVIDVAQARIAPFFGVPASALKPGQGQAKNNRPERHFIRLKVYDRPGVLADVTAILRQHDISVESINQPSRSEDGVNGDVPVILTTHETTPSALTAAIAEITDLSTVLAEPVVLSIGHD